MIVAIRCAFVGLAELLAGFALQWLTRPVLSQVHDALVARQSPVGGWTLERIVVAASAFLACLVFTGLAMATAATMATAVRRHAQPCKDSGPASRLCGPLWWRRAVLWACGLGLAVPVGASASPAGHDDLAKPGPAPHSICRPEPSLLAGLRLPDLPVSSTTQPARRLVVRAGDSLWLIARATLPPSAPDSAVCRRVHALYAANRVAIGADPDLIFPGTELTQPGGTA